MYAATLDISEGVCPRGASPSLSDPGDSRPGSPVYRDDSGNATCPSSEFRATEEKLGSLNVFAGISAFLGEALEDGYLLSESMIKTLLAGGLIGSKFGSYSFNREELSTSQKVLGTVSSTLLSSAGIYGSYFVKDLIFSSIRDKMPSIIINLSNTNLLMASSLAPIPAVLLVTYFTSKEARVSKYFKRAFHTAIMSRLFLLSLNSPTALVKNVVTVYQQMAFIRIGKDFGGIWGAKLGQKLGKKLDDRVITPIINKAKSLFDRAKSKVSQIFFKSKES
jgi:hypothetical protein